MSYIVSSGRISQSGFWCIHVGPKMWKKLRTKKKTPINLCCCQIKQNTKKNVWAKENKPGKRPLPNKRETLLAIQKHRSTMIHTIVQELFPFPHTLRREITRKDGLKSEVRLQQPPQCMLQVWPAPASLGRARCLGHNLAPPPNQQVCVWSLSLTLGKSWNVLGFFCLFCFYFLFICVWRVRDFSWI